MGEYFQDITPPGGRPRGPHGGGPHREHHRSELPPDKDDGSVEIPIRVQDTSSRSIRDISIMRRGRGAPEMSPLPRERSTGRRGLSGKWIWGAAILSVLVLAGLLLFALRATSVSVLPKSHIVVFDNASSFTAYPEAGAAEGALTYAVKSAELEDSESVAAEGSTHTESKASGSVTVFNDFSSTPVRLIKNTRFQSASGLIFRAPADIVLPGRKGTTPGQIRVTIVADAVGEKYNIPATRFTLPGLKSTPDMYAHISAESTAAFSGGFSGNAPAAAPGAIETARAEMRTRLQDKANREAAGFGSDATIALPAQITFENTPNTTESAGSVTIHEKARIDVVLVSKDGFAKAVAKSVSANSDDSPVVLEPRQGFALRGESASSTLGSAPLTFIPAGEALLVWKVDTSALAQALAGKEASAFQTIVSGFPGIEEAHARIEPFWKTTFPANPSSIKIRLQAPKEGA